MDTDCTAGLSNVLLQGTVSSVLGWALAATLLVGAALRGNLRHVGASEVGLVKSVSHQPVIEIVFG